MLQPAALSLALALALALSSPALAQIDPATTAMAAHYAKEAQTCMEHSVTMAVRAGQRTRPALLESTTARCGGTWVSFLVAHGEPLRQARAELTAMADRVIDAALKGGKR
ncbi:MAG: hypothetical protein JWO72_2530 [Caulobacteraceae bacterium]|nr:hypothetical protein [Caulobacteraceae bacterium]